MSTTYLEAIREGLWEEMERDANVFLIGEDIGQYGGAFKVTAGFFERFGARRVVDTPISEAAIVWARPLAPRSWAFARWLKYSSPTSFPAVSTRS